MCQAVIKILRVLTRLNIGGPAVHASVLSAGLDSERFSTCLVVGESDAREGDLSERFKGHPTRLIQIKSLRRSIRPWADAVALLQIVLIVWKERPDILHTHMAKSGTLGRLAGILYNRIGYGRTSGKKAVLIHTFHGHVLEGYFHPWLTRAFIFLERWLSLYTDRLIAVSAAIRQELLEKGIGREDQVQVISLGIDLSALAKIPSRNGSCVFRCGLVGRLVAIKNPSLFLEAVGQFVKQIPLHAVEAFVVGDGPLREKLEEEVRRRDLAGVVRFIGWQKDLRTWYECLDVVCLTSQNEGTPVCLIEAMAAGRVVVAMDVGGVRDLLEGKGVLTADIPSGGYEVTDRGILIRPGDAQGMAAALKLVAADAGLRRKLGEAARSYALKEFNQERLIQDISTLYEQLGGKG